MTTQDRIALAQDQLNRVLGFFSRVDGKHSVVLAVDTGMLAVLAANAPVVTMLGGPLGIAPGLAVLFVAISLGYLYAGGAPSMKGGQQSLVYFREISQRTEAKFIEESQRVSDDAYLKDLLGQIWRNSEILAQKFDFLQKALLFLAIAILPWLVALAEFAILSARVAGR